MDWQPYPAYKESGVDWLGSIPEHWQVERVKSNFRLRTQLSGLSHGMELLSVYTHIGVKPRKDLEQKGNRATTTDNYWVVRQGDIVANKLLAWMGAIGISEYSGVTSPAYDVLMPVKQLDAFYYHYLFRSPICLAEFKRRSRGIMEMRLRLYFDQFGQIQIPVPPTDEQTAIVRFVRYFDYKVSSLVRAKRRLIELLKEQKQSIVHRAITQGLDSSVKLKPSSIGSIDCIPSHWEIRKLRHVTQMLTSNVDKLIYEHEEPVRLCNYVDVYKNEAITEELPFMRATASGEEIERFRIKVGDVIITKDSEVWSDIGVPAVVRWEADDLVCGYHLAILRPKGESILGEFLLRCLQDRLVATQLHMAANGITRYGLSQGAIKSCLVPVPPINEQKEIVDHLQTATRDLTLAISKAQSEIDLLREYRTRLISDVVTGQLDVSCLNVRNLDVDEMPTELDSIDTEDEEEPELVEVN